MAIFYVNCLHLSIGYFKENNQISTYKRNKMKKLSTLLLFTALLFGQNLFAQYSGELGMVINNPETDIVVQAENSRDITFSVSGNLTEAQVNELKDSLESKDEISDVTVNNGVWKMHVAPETSRKILLSHFMNNGFKYITMGGNQEEILDFLSHKRKL